MKPTAFNLVRDQPVYRRQAFSAGLAAAGYEVTHRRPMSCEPGQLLLIWARYGENHVLAEKFEKGGGIVLVAENGYLGPGGISPHHSDTRTTYALARGWHNDASAIPRRSPERFDALGVDLKPWRADGGHILVCPNRSFGAPGRLMPSNWANEAAARLRKVSKREIRIRPHPGNHAPKRPLADDLAGAWATVIWSSSAGVHSLIAGVPVVCEAPFWIAKTATFSNLDELERAGAWKHGIGYLSGYRDDALHRLAHGQFHLDEITSGYAFRAVLG